MDTNWGHEKLAEDLAQTKGTGYLDVPLGSVYLQQPQRADVIEIKPSYTRFCLTIYEVKVSRNDFLSDIRTDKWKGYLEHCHRFYFAAPSGMLKKENIPDPAGLIVRGETGWSTIKAAKVIDREIPYMTLFSMLFNKQKQDSSIRHRDKICKAANGYMSEYEASKVLKSLGKRVSKALRMQSEYERKKDEYQWLIEDIRKQIAEVLGVEADMATWELRDLIREIKKRKEREYDKVSG